MYQRSGNPQPSRPKKGKKRDIDEPRMSRALPSNPTATYPWTLKARGTSATDISTVGSSLMCTLARPYGTML